MAPLAPVPTNLHRLALRVRPVDAATLLRLAWSDPATHRSFRRDARYRFDAPDGSYGVLYAAFDLPTAFVETVIRDEPFKSAGSRAILSLAELQARRVIRFQPAPNARALQLIELVGEGLVAARTDNQISAVDDYALTRAWARALHDHPLQADGLLYVSRFFAPSLSVALFDRCAPHLTVGAAAPLLAHPDLPALLDGLALAIERP